MDVTPPLENDEGLFSHGNTLLGSQLNPVDQALALRAHWKRYTGNHKPAWVAEEAELGIICPVQFASDEDWLGHTRFAVSPYTGKLDRRVVRCWEAPTWPGGEEMYGRPIKDLPRFVQARVAANLRERGWSLRCQQWMAQNGLI